MNKCNKTRYTTEKDALFDLKKIQKTSDRNNIPVRSYYCSKCKGFHLTSKIDYKEQIEELKIKLAKLNDIFKNYKRYLQEEKTINAELLKEINDKNKKIDNQKILIRNLECKLQGSSQVKIKRHPRFKE